MRGMAVAIAMVALMLMATVTTRAIAVAAVVSMVTASREMAVAIAVVATVLAGAHSAEEGSVPGCPCGGAAGSAGGLLERELMAAAQVMVGDIQVEA